jgi:hypothetical protein
MHTWIGAGGSASRVLEAILHLCAAGLGPPNLRLLMIDPDTSNGNVTRVKGLIEIYRQCQEQFADKLGSDLNLFRMFGTKLVFLDTDKGEQGLKIWNPISSQRPKLGELLNYNGLSATSTSPDIAHLFFTKAELEMELAQGFRGHTAIGAAAMSLVSLDAGRQPWQQVVTKLEGDIALPTGARVFLVGSVFGGTGASALHPIVRFLRTIPKMNEDRLRIGVAALVPYFDFRVADHDHVDMAAKAEWFPLATRSAVEFYQYLRANNDWPFDAMYWIGDNSPKEVKY